MSIIVFLVLLALIGLATWALTHYVKMPGAVKTIIVVVAVIVCILLALQAFGVWDELRSVDVPRL